MSTSAVNDLSQYAENLASLLSSTASEPGLSEETEDLQAEAPSEPETKQHALLAQEDVVGKLRIARNENSKALEVMIQSLGDAARKPQWRLPYGDSGVLDFVLSVLADQTTEKSLQIQCLRVTGNACADTDENRARVVQDRRLSDIVTLFKTQSLVPYLIPVTYNVLLDYEPAQKLAAELGLSQTLIDLLTPSSSADSQLPILHCFKILGLLISHEPEDSLPDNSTPTYLLQHVPGQPGEEDVEDFVTIVTVLAAYLTKDKFQKALVEDEEALDRFFDLYHTFATSLQPEGVEDEEVAAQAKQLRPALLSVITDMSALDEFPKYPSKLESAQSRIWHTLRTWLDSDDPYLQSTASLVLGNTARSDEVAGQLVHQVQPRVVQILSDPHRTDTQQLHAVLSFAKNLAIPQANKDLMGADLLRLAVPRLLNLDTLPQVQFGAVSLTRLLLVNSAANLHVAMLPLQQHTSLSRSGADAAKAATSGYDTAIDAQDDVLLRTLSVFERTDAEPVKMEAARAIATALRTVHRPATSDNGHKQPEKVSPTGASTAIAPQTFHGRFSVAAPLAFLLTQPKWPTLRSETWFVLALMARDPAVAARVIDVLEQPGVADVLKQTALARITSNSSSSSGSGTGLVANGQTSVIELADIASNSHEAGGEALNGTDNVIALDDPAQRQAAAGNDVNRADRENLVVMCSSLLKTLGEETLSRTQVTLLKEVIQGGTETVIRERQSKAS